MIASLVLSECLAVLLPLILNYRPDLELSFPHCFALVTGSSTLWHKCSSSSKTSSGTSWLYDLIMTSCWYSVTHGFNSATEMQCLYSFRWRGVCIAALCCIDFISGACLMWNQCLIYFGCPRYLVRLQLKHEDVVEVCESHSGSGGQTPHKQHLTYLPVQYHCKTNSYSLWGVSWKGFQLCCFILKWT